jgi:hypothetical protein
MRMRGMECVAFIKGNRNASKNVLGKPQGTRTLGRPMLRWEDIIKRYLKQENENME